MKYGLLICLIMTARLSAMDKKKIDQLSLSECSQRLIDNAKKQNNIVQRYKDGSAAFRVKLEADLDVLCEEKRVILHAVIFHGIRLPLSKAYPIRVTRPVLEKAENVLPIQAYITDEELNVSPAQTKNYITNAALNRYEREKLFERSTELENHLIRNAALSVVTSEKYTEFERELDTLNKAEREAHILSILRMRSN